MMIFKKAMPRRIFLRGAGASLALPFLDAMIPALASTTEVKPPLRLGYIYLPVGRIMEEWTPGTEGSNFDLTPTLAPFAPYREQMLVLSGLDIKAADLLPGESGAAHERPCAAYLTGVHPYANSVGISVDQVIARQVGRHTPLASMQLGIDPPEWVGGGTDAFAGFYRATLSWASPTNALPTQNDPGLIFERMFGDTSSLDPETMRRRIRRQASILDSVSEEVKQLRRSVKAGDRYKLEEYLDAVRDIERGIQAVESRTVLDTEEMEGVKRPVGIPETVSEHARLILDLMHLAYQTDMTRVITFMLGHEETNRTYLELGIQDGHHAMSHHRGDPVIIERLKKVDRLQSEIVASFLEKMRVTTEADGTSLLDNTCLMVGSCFSDGNNHYHNDVPVAVFGGAQGRFQGGRHIRYNHEPLSNLHLAVLEMFGAPTKEYLANETSDATGILAGLG